MAYSEQKKKWRAANMETLLVSSRKWKENNPDKIREYKRKYRLKNLEKVRAQQKARNDRHKEKRRLEAARHYHTNRDRILEEQRADRAANPEKYRQRARDYRASNLARMKVCEVRGTAKEKGVDFDLDLGWFEIRLSAGVCEMSGLPFDGLSGRRPNSPSVDRKNPTGGYTKDNCRLILWWLNRALSNLGEEYALTVFRAVISKRDNPQK